MKKELSTETEKTMTQEVDRIKDLIVQGSYTEAFTLACRFNSEGDTLEIEKLILFKIEELCKILRVPRERMHLYIKTDQIHADFTDDSLCYISLESLLKYIEDFI